MLLSHGFMLRASRSSWKSPSEFARNPDDFSSWKGFSGVLHADPCEEVKTLYSKLSEFKPPQWLNELPQEEYLKGQADFFQHLKDWSRLQESLADDTDPNFNLKPLLSVLSLSFLKIQSKNEASRRLGMDDIVELVFGLQKDRKFDVLQYPSGHNYGILPPLESEVARNAFWSPVPPESISVIAFPSEHRRLDLITNCNQVIMDLATAQSQRRALGFKDDIIFGVAGARGEAAVLSSWWEDGRIRYTQHENRILTDPAQFVQFYVFLCKLADHAQKHLQAAVVDLHSPKYRAETLKANTWRAPDPPHFKRGTKRSRPSDHDEGGSATDGGKDVALDDLEPKESTNWKDSMEMWQTEKKRAWDEVTHSGVISLSRDHVGKYAKLFTRPSDQTKALTDSVDIWRLDVLRSRNHSVP
ncbi:hypothetical protein A0H81_11031 [Grifola frondosa]|uniref:Uncharacterized protein n=1 Tax=Grifola frondosa TaxID=5627 RepID=A0A1C7LVA3_GRIFR|nr:hypothetical protein A0H81_11031 [Grifola frondosa]